jgi:hypothetical protein
MHAALHHETQDHHILAASQSCDYLLRENLAAFDVRVYRFASIDSCRFVFLSEFADGACCVDVVSAMSSI